MGTTSDYSFRQIQTVPAGASGLTGQISFRMDLFRSGILITPAALEATTKLAFMVSYDDGSNFVDLRSASNVLEEIAVDVAASHAYALPADLAGARYVQIWCEAGGVLVQQSGPRVFTLLFKA
jgi:hypothetical protein